jgi:hypothetical protein
VAVIAAVLKAVELPVAPASPRLARPPSPPVLPSQPCACSVTVPLKPAEAIEGKVRIYAGVNPKRPV